MDLGRLAPLIAQNVTQYNRGMSFFQWGVTGVGIAVLVGAAALALQKAKPGASRASLLAQRIVCALVAILGLAIIAYAWLGFSRL